MGSGLRRALDQHSFATKGVRREVQEKRRNGKCAAFKTEHRCQSRLRERGGAKKGLSVELLGLDGSEGKEERGDCGSVAEVRFVRNVKE